ncbi:protein DETOXIFICATION 45 [Populus alba x Populus x berolinensis]|uniref:Protein DETOXIFICATION 45 n=1 Tax=Populus alba x Populus x berolinensis TaxID=444605 RepID=A0AAD6MKC2_9ROSI|nr:protein DETOXIFICATION 45 [Populus alba x Populus x berolinensis]
MASTRKLSGNTLCSGLTSRSSGEQSKLTNVKRQLCLPSQNEVPKSLGGGDAASRKCHLCAEQMTSLLPLVIRRRKTRFGVVYSQSSSGYGVDSTGVQERLVLEEEERDIVNGSRDEEFESTGVPIKQPHSSDVKHELIMLSLPAIAGQAIDPFAQLMETAFIGRLGPVELGSAGVSVMIFNNISKLFNIPLLSVATSFVAEDIAKNATKDTTSEKDIQEENSNNGKPIGLVERKQLSSVSTALLLAIGIGIFEAVALSLGCGSFLNLMGITVNGILFSLSLPIVNVVLPHAGLGNLSAIFLFPTLMYYLKLGVTGAAISTVVSQYLVTILMVWQLNKRVILLPPKIGELQFGVYMKSGIFVFKERLPFNNRSIADGIVLKGICALIASYSSEGDYMTVKEVTNFVLKIGLVVGVFLAVILGVSFGSVATLFTKDADVLRIVRTGILMLVGLVSSAFLLYAPPIMGLPGVWSGLALFMGLRTVAGYMSCLQTSPMLVPKAYYYQNLVHGGSCMRIWRLFRLASVQDTGSAGEEL